jgi:hypothetical protein
LARFISKLPIETFFNAAHAHRATFDFSIFKTHFKALFVPRKICNVQKKVTDAIVGPLIEGGRHGRIQSSLLIVVHKTNFSSNTYIFEKHP